MPEIEEVAPRQRFPFEFSVTEPLEFTNKHGTSLYFPGPTTSYNCSVAPLHDELYLQCVKWANEEKLIIHSRENASNGTVKISGSIECSPVN